RLVAVSYPVDADYVRINSEIPDAELVYTYELQDAPRREVLRRADVLVAWELPQEVPAGALAEASRLRLVQLPSARVHAGDFSAIPDRLVIASNAGAYAAAMSEHVLAMTLCLAKRLPQRHAAMAAGRYDKWEPLLTLDGAIGGILGFGGIGTATARLMRAFGARIHAINRTGPTSGPGGVAGTLAGLDPGLAAAGGVLAAADVLLVSLPLTLATRGLLGKRELALMKPTAILVNVARGAIIDQGALYEHLRAHPQFGAGIDTWWDEPTGDAPFRTDYPFFDLPNLIGS